MAQASRARKEAAAILGEVRRREARAREVLRASKRLEQLDERDRSFAVRLVLGVTGSIGLLDQTLQSHVRKGMRIEPRVRDALRISIFELLFLSTPPSAAVSQGVELVRRASPRATRLANAVLRRVAEQDTPRRKDALTRVARRAEQEGDLELVSGYPAWLISCVQREHGKDVVRDLALSALDPAPVYVAANEELASEQEVELLLKEAGLQPQRTDVADAFELLSPAGLSTCGLVQGTQVVVADLNAQRVAQSMIDDRDISMLEVGQGRGTKSILMCSAAKRAGRNVSIMGLDLEPFKVDVAKGRMARAGLGDAVRCVVADACLLSQKDEIRGLDAAYDVVFVDAPCSGTGTMRRHPEIAWSIDAKDVEELSSLQLDILTASSTRVAPGGMLGYATCSIMEQENRKVVEAFLLSQAGAGFELIDNPFVTTPAPHAPDGHFCARMRRI